MNTGLVGRTRPPAAETNILFVRKPRLRGRPNGKAAHEAVFAVAQTAVNDNTTPTEKRNGVADRYQSAAAVRGGAMLLRRIAPELLDGYARYYVRAAGQTPSSDPMAQLDRLFPLPEVIRESIDRQIGVVIGGI